MGRMIKEFYAGVFIHIDVRYQDYEEIKDSDEFYENVIEENFLMPYQGLEELSILIPNDGRYSLNKDRYEEFYLTELNFTNLERAFKNDNKEILEEIFKYFDESLVKIKSGVVSYWDEEA
tara:strand:- start:27782 stop:28141 length:360 start_codon:yes stop_codon:yes gene_type:complete